MATFDPNKPALLQLGARQAPQAAQAAGRGLLSRVGGAALGPIGLGAQALLRPGELGDGELTEEQKAALGTMPKADADAYRSWAEGVAGRAAQAGINTRNQHMPAVDSRIQPTAMQEPTGDVSKVPNYEPLRQQAKAGLEVAQSRGELPVKEIATALVDKQIEASGEKTSPEDRQKRISQERKLISDLPSEERSDYLSWALIAAGLVASAVDEGAGQAFAGSLDASLKRAHERNMKVEERTERKAAREEEREFQRENFDRQDANIDKRFDQQDKMQERQFAQQKLLFDEGQKLQREQMAQQASYQSAMLGLRQQQLEAKLAASQGGAAPKLDLKQEDAEKITDGVSSQLGYPLSKEVNRSLSAQLRAAAKTDPNFDPQRFVQVWLNANADKLEKHDPWGPGDNITRFKPLKQ